MTGLKKRDLKFGVIDNENIADKTWRISLEGDTSGYRAGQFVEVMLDGFFLRRPISVSYYSRGRAELIYKVVGRGTDYMTSIKKGDALNILGPLGNGFDTGAACESPVIIGAGAGVAPMLALAKELCERGVRPGCLIGFNSSAEVFLYDELKNYCSHVCVTTMDGSRGIKGLVTDGIGGFEKCDYYYACGPIPMLRSVVDILGGRGQVSLEARMGCGFGGCMGCSIMTKHGSRRVCKEGPVFMGGEIIWQTLG